MTTAQPSLSAAQPGPAAAGQPALPDQTDAPAPVVRYQPDLFAHWQLIAFTASRTVGAG